MRTRPGQTKYLSKIILCHNFCCKSCEIQQLTAKVVTKLIELSANKIFYKVNNFIKLVKETFLSEYFF